MTCNHYKNWDILHSFFSTKSSVYFKPTAHPNSAQCPHSWWLLCGTATDLDHVCEIYSQDDFQTDFIDIWLASNLSMFQHHFKMGWGFGIVNAEALVRAVAQVWSLWHRFDPWPQLPEAADTAVNKNNKS